jgi:hypothetical protein
MAEFISRRTADIPDEVEEGFNAMGKPIPNYRKQEAYKHCKQMGLNSAQADHVVSGMSAQLERDEPYTALDRGCDELDLTGAYRIMAVLLTAQEKTNVD